jgi:hypothetical protein
MDVYLHHVPPPKALRLPKGLELAQRYVSAFDPRPPAAAQRGKSVRLRPRAALSPSAGGEHRHARLSDVHIQARDGYIHVASVHPNVVRRPWAIVAELMENGRDTWAVGGADKLFDELEYEKALMKESRRRRRLALFTDIAKDHYDLLDRHGNPDGTERTRVSNAGTEASPKAA